MVHSMGFLKSTDIMQCLQWNSEARKFNIFAYWHKNNSTTCKQPCSAQWRGSCMTRKSLQSLIIRKMDTDLLASGERLFRSRLYIPSSGHLLSSLSDEMALQQNPRLVHFGFPTANHSCNKEEKPFCSEAARGPNEMWHINFWAMKLYNPSGFTFRIQGSHRGWDSLFCENSVYFTHCLWLVLPHIIISGSNLLLEKLGLINYYLYLSKDVQEMSALLLYETGQNADIDRQTDG